MREVKFRVKLIEPNGDYDNVYLWLSEFQRIRPDIKIEIRGQFTGLKDKNGQEIYEGDIVKSLTGSDVGVVQYDENLSQYRVHLFKKRDPRIHIIMVVHFTDGEIIGNIYENPELLESK